jgi:hypothetical protein
MQIFSFLTVVGRGWWVEMLCSVSPCGVRCVMEGFAGFSPTPVEGGDE